MEIQKETGAYKVEIFIGCDDRRDAELICEDFCTDIGLCVTVTDTVFTYRGGRCNGVIIGLINYARFPDLPAFIFQKAVDLAYKLKEGLKQGSFTVQDHRRSVFVSTRDEDQPK